jgi:putative endonuclease
MLYFLYILQSRVNQKFYIGSSEYPERHLLYHASIEKGFTSRYRPWKLVFVQKFLPKSIAQKAERKTKVFIIIYYNHDNLTMGYLTG